MTVTPFVDWPDALELVLASRSPRRADLLQVAGLPFVVELAADVEAELAASLARQKADPVTYATTLARAKAVDVAERFPSRLVLGADTIVVVDGQILEKPINEADAVRLLTCLAGRRHTVISAIYLVGGDAGSTGLGSSEATEVTFLPLSHEAIVRYVATGEPMDKAGAYGIQGYGAMMVAGIQGCYFNVMGLPLARLGVLLRTVLQDSGQ